MKLSCEALDYREEFRLVREIAFMDLVIQHNTRGILSQLYCAAEFIGFMKLSAPPAEGRNMP